jgi:hypothetical protein
MPEPLNHNQLELLTSTQAALIDAALEARSLKVAELVEINFTKPTAARKIYSWWNCLSDPAYTDALTEWLDGDPLIPAFIAKDALKRERFHNIPRTAALSDDTIQMEFANYGRVFEGLAVENRGARVEVWLFFPEIPDDAAGTDYSVVWQFTGHLMRNGPANEDFVPIAVRSGIRSPNVIVPSWVSGSNCQNYYNGHKVNGVRVFPTGLPDNPCDIDLHYGGTKGTVDPGTGELWATCNKTFDQGSNNCVTINGSIAAARRIYGGDDYVIESTLIGRGDHKTRSSTIGNESRNENERVIYGKRHVKQMHVRRMAKEFHPDEEHQDLGTVRLVASVSHGPIQSITEVKASDRPLPRSDGLGLETRLGTQRQEPTTYSDDMMGLNRIAHIRGDLNPIDPTGMQPQDLSVECVAEGRNTINIYAADGSFTQGYTYNRADCMTDYLLNQWYGYRMDKARLLLDDIVYLRALNSNFHADLQARTIQQHIEDTCRAAVGGGSPGWFRPFFYDRLWRFLPILNTDLTLADIPVIKSNFGADRRVIIDESTKLPQITPDKKDTLDIHNSVIVNIEDAEHGNIDRQITFNADDDQYREGELYGDESKRRDPKQVDGTGLTTEAEARILGEFLIKMGEFCTGGLLNNGTLKVTIPALWSVGLNAHQNKLVKFPIEDNDRLEHYKDTEGNPFEFYMITSLYRNSRLDLEINLQAWSEPFWENFCTDPGGQASGWVKYSKDDSDVIDGAHGVGTMIYSVTADRAAMSATYPDTINQANIIFDRWTHYIAALPPEGNSYFISFPNIPLGFLVWFNGQVWIYSDSGIDMAVLLPPGSVGPSDRLSVEWDDNGGDPVRRYKLNGVLLIEDSAPATTITPTVNDFGGTASTTGMYIGETFWEVIYTGCTSDYEVQPVGQTGTSVVQGTPGTTTELAPVAIESEESFGTPTVIPGAVSLAPSPIGSDESFGTAVVAGGEVIIAPEAIPSDESFGTAEVEEATDADLVLWLAAWKETGYSNNDPMATLVDFSGDGHDFTQATSGSRPLYQTGVLNSQPGFFFDGTDDYAEIAAFMSGDAEAYFVLKCNSGAGLNGCYKFDGGTNANHITFSGSIFTSFGGATRYSYTPVTGATAGFIHQIQAKAGSSQWIVFENGNNTKITQTNTQSWSGGSSPKHLIGASSVGANGSPAGGTNQWFHGHILEVRIYSSPRSTAQRNAILAEFNSRYGISVTNF